MREILFRGKVEDDFFSDSGKLIYKKGEWVYGYLASPDVIVGGICDMDENYISFDWWVTVDPITVGQYTGLTDKNRKKIFEGDIIRKDDYSNGWALNYEQPKRNVVACYSAKFRITRPSDNGDYKNCEVIGNIHDNPKLLEESK